MVVGILALQGAVGPHVEKLESLGVQSKLVRRPADLENLAGIILPGGESTTMIHLLKLNGLWEPLQQFVRTKPTWGICAGAILLANEVSAPTQDSLKAIDVSVERNSYGRQLESFIAQLSPDVEGVFIRAPRITRVGNGVKTLLKYKEDPVLVQTQNILLGTFHPELTNNPQLHQYFTKWIADSQPGSERL